MGPSTWGDIWVMQGSIRMMEKNMHITKYYSTWAPIWAPIPYTIQVLGPVGGFICTAVALLGSSSAAHVPKLGLGFTRLLFKELRLIYHNVYM